MSPGKTITKTVWQYSEPLPQETKELLKLIRKVKPYGTENKLSV